MTKGTQGVSGRGHSHFPPPGLPLGASQQALESPGVRGQRKGDGCTDWCTHTHNACTHAHVRMHKGTHLHTHTCMHTGTHTQVHTCIICAQMCMGMRTHAGAHMHHMCTHTGTHKHGSVHHCMRKHICTTGACMCHMQEHTCITGAHMHKHTWACTHMQVHACITCACAGTHVHGHMYIHCMCEHMHDRCTRAYTYMHGHVHADICRYTRASHRCT